MSVISATEWIGKDIMMLNLLRLMVRGKRLVKNIYLVGAILGWKKQESVLMHFKANF